MVNSDRLTNECLILRETGQVLPEMVFFQGTVLSGCRCSPHSLSHQGHADPHPGAQCQDLPSCPQDSVNSSVVDCCSCCVCVRGWGDSAVCGKSCGSGLCGWLNQPLDPWQKCSPSMFICVTYDQPVPCRSIYMFKPCVHFATKFYG